MRSGVVGRRRLARLALRAGHEALELLRVRVERGLLAHQRAAAAAGGRRGRGGRWSESRTEPRRAGGCHRCGAAQAHAVRIPEAPEGGVAGPAQCAAHAEDAAEAALRFVPCLSSCAGFRRHIYDSLIRLATACGVNRHNTIPQTILMAMRDCLNRLGAYPLGLATLVVQQMLYSLGE